MRRFDGVRVYGPYQHKQQWRVHFVTYPDGTRHTTYESFATRAEAEECVAAARDEAQGTTLRMAVDAFLERKRQDGLASTTVENYEHRLWRLLGLPGNADKPLRFVASRGEELYLASIKDGASDTHINGLNVGRMWGQFCIEAKLMRANPFANVKRRGRKVHGSTKPRLSVDESRRLEAFCLASPMDQDCILTYGYMMLGKRASELVGVQVRDLDDGGRILRIRKAKSAASVKAIGVPDVLRQMLTWLAQGREPSDHLFTNESGKPMSRYVARDRVRAVCKEAKVPELSPQALRRTFTDNATLQGIALKTIAEMTGHTSIAVTQRSYVSGGIVDSAAIERNQRMLRGETTGETVPVGAAQTDEKPSAIGGTRTPTVLPTGT